MLRSTFSTTTIASSTTMPIDRKPHQQHHGKGADDRYRNRQQRNDRRPPRLQKDDHDDDDEQDRFQQRVGDRANRRPDELRRVVDDPVLDALGHILAQLLHRAPHAVRNLQRVGPGSLEYRDGDG
jgi:hypothetical protein